VEVRQPDAGFRQLVEIGRGDLAAKGPQIRKAQVIGQDYDDIGSLRSIGQYSSGESSKQKNCQ
jgi:hypothetical protein